MKTGTFKTFTSLAYIVLLALLSLTGCTSDQSSQNGSANTITTLTVQGNLADGEVLNRFCKNDWSTCRNASSGNAQWEGLNVHTVGAGFDSKGYTIERAFFFFDTSSIPKKAQITGATLSIYVGQYQHGTTTMDVVRSMANMPLSQADYSRIEFVSGGSGTPNSPNSWLNITLSLKALNWIVKGGMTKLALINELDLNNAPPTGANDSLIAAAEDTDHRPYLVINGSDVSKQSASGPVSGQAGTSPVSSNAGGQMTPDLCGGWVFRLADVKTTDLNGMTNYEGSVVFENHNSTMSQSVPKTMDFLSNSTMTTAEGYTYRVDFSLMNWVWVPQGLRYRATAMYPYSSISTEAATGTTKHIVKTPCGNLDFDHPETGLKFPSDNPSQYKKIGDAIVIPNLGTLTITSIGNDCSSFNLSSYCIHYQITNASKGYEVNQTIPALVIDSKGNLGYLSNEAGMSFYVGPGQTQEGKIATFNQPEGPCLLILIIAQNNYYQIINLGIH